jgi:hypothetical protein
MSTQQPNPNIGPSGARDGTPGSAVGTASPGPNAVARPPLPHRRPQQHLAPELRDDDPIGGATGALAAIPMPRSPEEARSRFARYQQGWAEGRAAPSDEPVINADQGRNA